MEGGSVTGNTALHGGGGIANYGTMVLAGGAVTGNEAHRRGGGVFNYATAHLTVNGDAVFGNSAPKGDDIFNEGMLTVSGAQPGGAYSEEMPVLRRYMNQLSILPVAALLLAVWLDAYLTRERKRAMIVIIALVFSMILQNYLDNWLSLKGANNALRLPVTIYGYAVRPVILAMFLHIVKPGGRYRAAWALIAVNAAVYLTAFFSPIAFSFTPYGHWGAGPLHHTCTVVSALLLTWLFWLTMRQFRLRARKES